MTPERINEILTSWSAIENIDPSVSTERLISMTADACDCDIDDVIEALAMDAEG